jgi:RimJ/RimL family protein N-acetyltransferase
VSDVLRTSRLSLTPHSLADFDDSAALWGDPAVVRYITGAPSTGSVSWSRLQRYAGNWALLGYGYWVVRETASGRFAGEVGFGDFRRDMAVDFAGAPEAGWVLATWAHGQGYASEAVAAALAWGDAQFDSDRTVCMIDPDNAPSLRVADKSGYVEFGRTDFRGSPVVLLQRPKGQVRR